MLCFYLLYLLLSTQLKFQNKKSCYRSAICDTYILPHITLCYYIIAYKLFIVDIS